jgi:hypothetical protein
VEPAPVAEPAPAPAPSPAKEKKVKVKAAPQRCTAGSAILCVLICLCSLLTISLLMVRSLTTRDFLQASVENALADVDLTQISAEELVPDAEDDESLAAYIARQIEKEYVIDVDVDEDDVQKFLEDSTIISFVAEKFSGMADDIRTDRRGSGITEDDISELMRDNKKQIEKLVGVEMTQHDIDNVLKVINEEGVLEELSAKSIRRSEPAAYFGLQVLLSDVTIIVLIVLILGMAVLIVKSYHWNVCRSCGSIGVALIVGGGIFLLLCGAAFILPLAWNSMISYMIRMVVSGSLISSAVFFGLGVVMVVVDRVTRK